MIEQEDKWYCLEPLSEAEYATFGFRTCDPKPDPIEPRKLGEMSPTKILISRIQNVNVLIEKFGRGANILYTDRGP